MPWIGQLYCFRHVSLLKKKLVNSRQVHKPDQRESEVAINFLNPHGPARSFTYPEQPNDLVVGMWDMLTLPQQLEEHHTLSKKTHGTNV